MPTAPLTVKGGSSSPAVLTMGMKHLQAYLNEFTFRFNRRFYPFNAFRSLLGIAGAAEAPTYAELYSGVWTHPTCSGCLH
jgi:hypothetical protein